MPMQVTVYRCLIISPGDVGDEREAIVDVITRLNGTAFHELGLRVDPIGWDLHAVPDQRERPQRAINEQLVDTCDLGVAIFWTRLGTPTTDGHVSGSAEEISRLLQREARVMVYHKQAAVPQRALEGEEYGRLQKELKRYKDEGLLGTFETIDQLRSEFQLHLNALVTQLATQQRHGGQPIPAIGTLTAPTPDVRVRVNSAFVVDPYDQPLDIISVTVENHSPHVYFHASFGFELSDGYSLFVKQDSLTGALNGARKIDPGDSIDFNVEPHVLAERLKGSKREIKCAYSKDKIGRTFRSGPFDFKATVRVAERRRRRR